MTPQEIRQKKRQYEKSIYQFLENSNLSGKNNQNAEEKNKNVKEKIQKQQEKQLPIDKISIMRKQATTKLSMKSNQSKGISNLNEVAKQTPYTSLLSSITKEINLMNNHISSQIHQNQHVLLAGYQIKMKAKIAQLNKLKSTTNEQMIKEKTILRKQQLQREKKQLIEGNFYYDQKLKQIKKQLQGLMNKRDNLRKNLEVLPKQTYHNEQDQQPKSYAILLKQNTKNQQSNSEIDQSNFVENVLKKYNEKSDIFQESLTQSITIDKSSRVDINTSFTVNLKNSLHFPKIKEKKNQMHQSLNPQTSIDQYPLRKNQIKANRAQSIQGISSRNLKVKNKINAPLENKNVIFKNYLTQKKSEKNSTSKIINKTVSFGSIQNQTENQDVNKLKKKTETYPETVDVKIHPFSCNKQDLEQFIIKKITNDKKSSQQKIKQKKLKQLQIYEKQIRQFQKDLKKPLKIEIIFKNCIKQFYEQKKQLGLKKIRNIIQKYEQNDLGILKQVDQISFQNSRIALENYENVVKNQIDEKKAMKLLEQNQFDKKSLIDMFFQNVEFKRLIYDLISSQVQKTSLSQVYNHLKRPVNGFYGLSM